jgi:hypothetical protein
MRTASSPPWVALVALALSFGWAGCQPVPPGGAAAPGDAAGSMAPAVSAQALAARALTRPAQIASTDARGVPKFVWGLAGARAGAGEPPEAAARGHLARLADLYGVDDAVVRRADVRFVRRLGRGGYLAKFHQTAAGVEVYPSDVAVLMRADLSLVAVTGALRAVGAVRGPADFRGTPEAALVRALEAHTGARVDPAQLVPLGEPVGHRLRFRTSDDAAVYLREGQVRPIYFTREGGADPAYFVEFFAAKRGRRDTDAARYIVSARDLRVLDRRDLTQADAFDYRVWVDADGRPHDGPQVDFSPYPTPTGDLTTLPELDPSPTLMSVEGLNTSPGGTPDPWLDASATQTFGNNVDAYSDFDDIDGFSNGDYRATTTGARRFDRTLNLSIDPVADTDQTMASVTSLFYVTNWLHDWWYDSGFDEAAGNAQLDNLGRGGVGGDVLHAEAQDSVFAGFRNNADMSTPSDGMSPRMQMYNWTGRETVSLTVPPAGLRYDAASASFGASSFDVRAPLVAGVDALGTTTGCSPTVGDVAGRIVLFDRGGCDFTAKAASAQAAGAAAVIIVNNQPGPAPSLGGSDPSVTIGALSLSQTDGAALRALLQAGPVEVAMSRRTDPDRDGALDYMVVSHEWGHYLHHRLVDCSSTQCGAMSEGWADFSGLYVMLRPGDDLLGAFPVGVYATRSDDSAGYFGIRRLPYSKSREYDDLSFRHIADGEPLPTGHPVRVFGNNAEVHNAGEVWATMMFDAYVSLQQSAASTGRSFAEIQRRMADYVVAGMALAPFEPTMIEQRDAIIAAISAVDPADAVLVAEAFARRGAGTCAVGPDVASTDLVGVAEATTLQAKLVLGAPTVDDGLKSCDGDGILDGDERGVLRFTIANSSIIPSAPASIALTASDPSVGFPGGAVVALPALGAFEARTVEVEVAVDPALGSTVALTLDAVVTATQACEPSLTVSLGVVTNADEQPGRTLDTVETTRTAWVKTGAERERVWSRRAVAAFEHVWHGEDLGSQSDTRLETPTLQVSTAEPLTLDFDWRHQFEADDEFDWDGMVLEFSVDDGATWVDTSTLTDLGYGGVLTDISGNPLAGRSAWVGETPAWPAMEHVHLDLGTSLAGRAVRFRFRIGTDLAGGFAGVDLDNLAFGGLISGPFYGPQVDAAVCPVPLVADAGPDRSGVAPAALVRLDGAGSRSATALPLTFAWAQLGGPSVTLVDADAARPVFVAPALESGATLTFELTVADGTRTAADTVTVEVDPAAAPTIVADAGNDRLVEPGILVVLDGSNSQARSQGLLTYRWTQTGGPAVPLEVTGRAVVQLRAPYPPTNVTMEFTLEVSDGVRSATDTVLVTTQGYALGASAGADARVPAGAMVVLDASQSRSSTNLPLGYAWTQRRGPTVILEGAASPYPRWTAPIPTSATMLEFEVRVSDGARTATDAVTIIVDAAPADTIVADAGDDRSAAPGTTVVLTGGRSASALGLPLGYAWRQTAGGAVTLKDARTVAPSFVAEGGDEARTLSFELTVSTGAPPSSATDTVNITVEALPKSEGGCNAGGRRSGLAEGAAYLAMVVALRVRRRRRGAE